MYICVCVCVVLSPVTAKATLQLSMSPGEDLDVPQALANLLLDHISITLAKQQVRKGETGAKGVGLCFKNDVIR